MDLLRGCFDLAHLHEGGFSLHGFRWDHALHAGRKICGEDFPDEVTVFLLEAPENGLRQEYHCKNSSVVVAAHF